MLNGARVAVIIVGFRNAGDVRECLKALAEGSNTSTFGVLICENGGPAAFDALLADLSAPDGPCAGEPQAMAPSSPFVRLRQLRLAGNGSTVLLGEANENLGYAGGINAWIRRLETAPDWQGIWILNPDTKPEPGALSALVAYAAHRGKGMVGSRAMYMDNPDIVRTRGLRWRKLTGSVLGVDIYAPTLPPPDPDDVEARIDAPSGCSFYVTRDCLERIGLMDERYFLFYEDLDWGLRARACCGVGYAYDSVVPHLGGSSIGSQQHGARASALSVYLDFRNRVIFVRRHYRGWLAWTVAMALVQTLRLVLPGGRGHVVDALKGLYAGLSGETGRPDHMMRAHLD